MKTKGLEPIVAAVLLIVVAVIGAVLVYLWFAGYVTKATSQAEQMAASEKLKIEAASLKATNGEVTLYVRNLTNLPVKWSTLYILQAGTNTIICGPRDLSGATNYNKTGDILKVDAIMGCSLTVGYDYTIKLVTARGTEIATTVTAS
ncbi:archaellin/type IV pilin N-terminal domain-containing protein [Pyrobaculum aerophilum]|uniref:Flagellar biosynthesis protein FlaG n=1 Tax=Pyrobaculum aerophilum TaxID=13773 RepID=A0A371QY06_9CREN|nr:archaellin/type IV pilin N-terminal domain-containing protein [Pyrobaculum aerophilum]RFA95568.1 flagellar biosynthesis protein FlaG [Pyrobaculum aerophilum]RFA98274.1 flagellar biosynthesis protein FlaG [Pyrobaculum aerophilum]